mgnify:CR=1 FL=1|jgi:hypothetical protein
MPNAVRGIYGRNNSDSSQSGRMEIPETESATLSSKKPSAVHSSESSGNVADEILKRHMSLENMVFEHKLRLQDDSILKELDISLS